jgi:hypothetical protein
MCVGDVCTVVNGSHGWTTRRESGRHCTPLPPLPLTRISVWRTRFDDRIHNVITHFLSTRWAVTSGVECMCARGSDGSIWGSTKVELTRWIFTHLRLQHITSSQPPLPHSHHHLHLVGAAHRPEHRRWHSCRRDLKVRHLISSCFDWH